MSDAPVAPIKPFDAGIEPPKPIEPLAPDGGIAGIEGAVPRPGQQLKEKQARPWFLKEVKTSDPMTSQPAAREIVSATPFVDGHDIFRELEELIDGAKSTVLLAYWAVDLETKMVTDSDRTWKDLLVGAAGRGVKVRVLVSDFDPALEEGKKHTAAWFNFVQLLQAGSKSSVSADDLQMVVARHPSEVPGTEILLAVANLYGKMADVLNGMTNVKNRQARFLFSPGLWDKITFDKSLKASVLDRGPFPAWPASIHQKVAIIDGRVALTGGVNIASQYIDTGKHDKPADDKRFGPWHDSYVRAEGAEIVRDFVSNYIGLWNQCRPRMDDFLRAQSAALKPTLKSVKLLNQSDAPWYASANRAKDMREKEVPIAASAPKTTVPRIPAQIRRTVSAAATAKPFFKTLREDIFEGYRQAIRQAEAYVYLENQYLRDPRIAEVLIERHRKNSNLRSILVIPSRSEEQGDPVTAYGNAMQYDNVKTLLDSVGSNVGVFMLERPRIAGDAAFKDAKAKTAIVYVHSKLLLVDDKFASIGSANTNPRSLAMDTELDFVWYDPKSVTALRLKLWKEHLGNPAGMAGWRSKDYVRKWTALAAANGKAKDKDVKGFVRMFSNDVHTKGLVDFSAYG
jgi:phosphatidylserine/phosphatidylglycerophosphate/cardiolipin synthase-like enzyme